MKSLQTIQKIFRVFQILAKIAFIFSIVGVSVCAVGALCAVTWYNGGTVFNLFGEPVTVFDGGDVSSLPSVVTGIVLILASIIFRYGAELEEQNRSLSSDREK